MKILTYNILNPYHAVNWNTEEGYHKKDQAEIEQLKSEELEKGETLIEKEGRVDNWPTRKQVVLSNLESSGFDVACLQEVCAANSYQDLKSRLSVIGLSLGKIEANEDKYKVMGPTIAYNPQTVDFIRQKIFEAKSNQRGQIYGDFKDKASGQIFRVASLHLKGYLSKKFDPTIEEQKQGWENKQKGKVDGYNELCDIVSEVESDLQDVDHIVLCGDFNEDQWEMEYPLSRQVKLTDSRYQFDGNLNPSEKRSERKIDWIFHKSLKNVSVNLAPMSFPNQNQEASDHLMVGTEISMKPVESTFPERLHYKRKELCLRA